MRGVETWPFTGIISVGGGTLVPARVDRGLRKDKLWLLFLALCPALLHRQRQPLPTLRCYASALLPFRCGSAGSDGLGLLDSEWRVGLHQRRNRSTDPISFLLQVRNYSF